MPDGIAMTTAKVHALVTLANLDVLCTFGLSGWQDRPSSLTAIFGRERMDRLANNKQESEHALSAESNFM